MMTAFQIGILLTVAVSAIYTLGGKSEEKKSSQVTLAISGVLFLLSELIKLLK